MRIIIEVCCNRTIMVVGQSHINRDFTGFSRNTSWHVLSSFANHINTRTAITSRVINRRKRYSIGIRCRNFALLYFLAINNFIKIERKAIALLPVATSQNLTCRKRQRTSRFIGIRNCTSTNNFWITFNIQITFAIILNNDSYIQNVWRASNTTITKAFGALFNRISICARLIVSYIKRSLFIGFFGNWSCTNRVAIFLQSEVENIITRPVIKVFKCNNLRTYWFCIVCIGVGNFCASLCQGAAFVTRNSLCKAISFLLFDCILCANWQIFNRSSFAITKRDFAICRNCAG